jgi:hypothetical protein
MGSPIKLTRTPLHPVGSVLSAMLTEPQFQSVMGTNWVLIDGRSVSGSDYAALTGLTTLPDARGMSLRASNNGGSAAGTRNDGNQNPDGVLSLGTFQADNFNSHNHGGTSGSHSHGGATGGHTHNVGVLSSLTESGSGGNVVGSGPLGGFNGAFNTSPSQSNTASISSDTVTIPSQGGNETRMKNITINHFIKINYE